MTNEEFEGDCLKCWVVKRWVPGLARRYGKIIEDKEDYKQEALLAIGSLPGCPGTDACRDLTYRMVRSAYRKYIKTFRENNTLTISAVYHNPGEQYKDLWKEIAPPDEHGNHHPEYGRQKKALFSPDEPRKGNNDYLIY